MALRLFICLSLVSFALAHDIPIEESTQRTFEECAAGKNVTEEDIHRIGKQEIEATPEIKEVFLCLTQKLGMFDGINWNMEEIKKVVNDPDKIKEVEECLKQDDQTLEPCERNFAMVSCCLAKEAFA